MPLKPLSKKAMTWICLSLVYIIWGSTYFAIRYVIDTMPTFLSMGVRFLLAAAFLTLILILKSGYRELLVPKKEVFNASIVGGLLLGLGIGTVAYAEHVVPTGIVALMISALPLWIAIFRTISGERLHLRSWFGIFIGFAGVAFLLRPGSVQGLEGSSQRALIFALALVLLGNFAWAIGTFFTPRMAMPKNALVLATYEMLAGGISLTGVGLLRGETFTDLLDASFASWMAFIYLITVGSIVAYSAYLWLVGNVSLTLTATYAYINPVIAVFLGVVFLREKFTSNMLFGGVIVLIGVLIVVSAESRASSSITPER